MKMSNHLRHQSTCDANVKYVFPGGVYRNKLSVFEELEEMTVRYGRRINTKNGLSVMILRRISRIFVKV